MIENPQTIEEKMENITELVHQYLPDMEVQWSQGNRTFGYYRFSRCKTDNTKSEIICISKPLSEVNTWSTIRLVVLHEIAHALTPGHNHDVVWQKKCAEIGGIPERYYSGINDTRSKTSLKAVIPPPKPRKIKPHPEVYRYLEVCDKCGALTGYGSRKTDRIYRHKCGGTLRLLPNPLFKVPDYNPDRILSELKEKLVSVLTKDKNTLAVACSSENLKCSRHEYIYVICRKVPEELIRRELYGDMNGLHEYAQISAGTDAGFAVFDTLTVKRLTKMLSVVYASADKMQNYVSELSDGRRYPETAVHSVCNPANITNAEFRFEKDNCWHDLTDRLLGLPAETFRNLCLHELNQAITEKILNCVASEVFTGIDFSMIVISAVHMVRAVYALNGRFCENAEDKNAIKEIAGFEKKPACICERLQKIFDSIYNRYSYPDSFRELVKLSIEINNLF